MNKFKLLLTAILSSALLFAGSVSAEATTKPVVVRPTVVVKYVYNCNNATVQVDFKNLSGAKDVYAKGDNGIYLVAKAFVFDATKVYDGLYYVGRVQQEDVYVTALNAGPYASHLAGGYTAATSQCPTYYPVFDSHWVNPTPPANAVSITLESNPDYWWRNTD